MATYKPKKRVITLKVNDLQQILAHFNNRHEKRYANREQEYYTVNVEHGRKVPFGTLRFWK